MTEYSIDDAAHAAGISAALIRAWEARYNWPMPHRNPGNGYRLFTAAQVADIKRFAALVRRGRQPSQLIRDGLPVWPATGRPTATEAWSCYEQLPTPPTAESQAYRNRLERALRQRNEPAIARMLHEAPLALRPAERTPGAWLPAYFGAREWQRLDRPLPSDVVMLLTRLAGGYVVELLRARWETAEAAEV